MASQTRRSGFQQSFVVGLLMVFMLPAGAWAADDGTIVVHTGQVVQPRFAGVGFHTSSHPTTREHFEQVLGKRWRELAPRFARVTHSWAKGQPGVSDPKALEELARYLTFMKRDTATEVYLTTMGPGEAPAGPERDTYASTVASDLEYLLASGATNVKYYCFTNELSLKEWADMRNDLPMFRDYQQRIYNELQRRHLDVKLLATDASPVVYWNTLEWAAANMDDITDVYGAHHYLETDDPADMNFYSWFLGRCTWASDLARKKGKNFILGEFGSRQYFDKKYGYRWDTCLHYGTPREPMAALQVAEAALAAINGGVYAMGYWTFTDYPEWSDEPYINQWGVFKWATNGSETRAPYYSYGLLTKFFGGPATVFRVEARDPKLRVAAVRHQDGDTWSIAVINRNPGPVKIALRLEGAPLAADFRKYVYDPANVPQTEDGDLQQATGKVALRQGEFEDTVGPDQLALYTTRYDDVPPAPVKGLKVSPIEDGRRIAWEANGEPDLCYYRVFHNRVRIGSTITTEFADTGPERLQPGEYEVVAVDQSGNASEPRAQKPPPAGTQ
jgi:hypothetical protein